MRVAESEGRAMRPLRVRFTVRRIMALTGLLAVGLAFLRHAATHWGPGEVTTLALTVLLATNVLAWFQGARWQVFWVGFGLCGWAFLMFSLNSSLSEHLPTTWLLDDLHGRSCVNRSDPVYDYDFCGASDSSAHAAAFRRAGQSVLSLFFALLGGSVAIVLVPKKSEIARLPDG